MEISAITHPRQLDLSCYGVVRVRIDGTQHAPTNAAAWRSAVEERRSGCVDSQIPRRELRILSACAPADVIIRRYDIELTEPLGSSPASGDRVPL